MQNGGRCYDCFRPLANCFCDAIPRIDNQTEVLILQHRREYFHRFNTARIVHKGLRNSRLLADHTQNIAKQLELKPRAGLLYPGATATLLNDLPVDERPEQLVVVDGTWHHTKTLVRDIPALQRLPRYQLAPATPSRYRIRREPNAAALSTLEATVEALRVLEPETIGLNQLLQAFDEMIETQLAHPGSANGARFVVRGSRTVKNIPLALNGNLANIIVAYGDHPAGEIGQKRTAGPPLTWVARRIADGAEFACTLIPQQPLSETFLGHLELTQSDFNAAISVEEARHRWAKFQRPGDIVAVLQPGTAQLLSHLTDENNACLVLKAVDFKSLVGTADSISSEPECSSLNKPTLGRATKRLAAAVALVLQLNALVNQR